MILNLHGGGWVWQKGGLLGRTTSKMGFILVDHFTVTHLVHNNFLINIFVKG